MKSFIGIVSIGVLALGPIGCGSKAPTEGVSGKVTLNGSPVAGQVVFVTSDGRQLPTAIGPDGGYTIMGLPKGEVDVLVKGDPPVNAMLPKGADPVGKPTSAGATPPEKYTKAGAGLKFDVTGSRQTHNIELTP